MLGIAPVVGRDFYAGEDTLEAPRTVMLSYAAWQKRFGGREDILGTAVTLDGAATTIVGVLPRDFYFGPVGAAEFWRPMHESLNPELRGERGILALARLKEASSGKKGTGAAGIASLLNVDRITYCVRRFTRYAIRNGVTLNTRPNA